MRFGSFFMGTIAVGALVGWFAPDLSRPAPPVAEASAVHGGDRLEVARSERWNADEIVLPRDRSGHFYAEVSTDTGKALMLVDTGATVVALTGNDAAMLGVDWNPGDVRPIARGASGDVYGAPAVLDRIDVGGIEARGVQAVVVPEGLDISLLGQSFLETVKQVEVSGDRMVLRD